MANYKFASTAKNIMVAEAVALAEQAVLNAVHLHKNYDWRQLATAAITAGSGSLASAITDNDDTNAFDGSQAKGSSRFVKRMNMPQVDLHTAINARDPRWREELSDMASSDRLSSDTPDVASSYLSRNPNVEKWKQSILAAVQPKICHYLLKRRLSTEPLQV